VSLRAVRRQWQRHALHDPLWAIAAVPGTRHGGWDEAEFFRTGEAEVDAELAHLRELGHEPARHCALDFGCGAGRLTQALARHFEHVDGVDVAPAMVALARRYNRHGHRCTYHECCTPTLPFPDGCFDLAYSALTLQHVPPRLARATIRELARVVACGGVLAFQHAAEPLSLPGATGLPRRLAALVRRSLPPPAVETLQRLRYRLGLGGEFPMYGLPRGEVEGLIAASGMEVIDVREDRAAGPGWTSFRYVSVKP
jgi:SAM-dependent methyltransferase